MSVRTAIKNYEQQQACNAQAVNAQNAGNDSPTLSPALKKALDLIQNSDYDAAVDFLAAAGREPQVRNALGVCLMRMGNVDKAVDVFRSFVLMPGTVQERPDVSNASKRNFATALLMKGFPSGSLSVLAEIHEPDHPIAVRIHSAIRQWEQSLSWYRWFDWKLNGIEPPKCHVPLDFEPGEFDFEVQIRGPVQTGSPRKLTLKLVA